MVSKSFSRIFALILVFTLSGVILPACSAPTPIAVAKTATPTATPSITPTFNATQNYQATLQANQTQNAVRELTREAIDWSIAATGTSLFLTPTSTPTPTITPTPLDVLLAGDSDSLQLSGPDFGAVANLAIAAKAIESSIPYCIDVPSDGCPALRFPAWDSYDFLEILNFEFSRHLKNVDVDYEVLMETLASFVGEHEYEFLPETIETLFIAAVIHELNSNSAIKLIDSLNLEGDFYTAFVKAIEVDQDPIPEWLVKVDREDFINERWLLLDLSETGEVKLIQTVTPSNTFSDYPGISLEVKVEDVTGDGKADAVFVDKHFLRGGGRILTVSVFQGEPSGLVSLFEISSELFMSEVYYQWVTDPESGISGIEIAEREFWTPNCSIIERFIYYWPEGIQISSGPLRAEPVSIDCAIALGAGRYNETEPLQAIAWFRYALDEDGNSRDLTDEEKVFIYFHLAILYARTGDDAISRSFLDKIHIMAISGETEIAALLWSEIRPIISPETIRPLPLCLASMNLPMPEVNGPGVDDSPYFYRGIPDGYAYPLCWPVKLEEEILSKIRPDSIESLRNELIEEGIQYEKLWAMKLESGRNAWFLLVENPNFNYVEYGNLQPTRELLLYGYLDGIGWNNLYVWYLENGYEITEHDWTGDGREEIGIAVEDLPPWFCPADTRAFSVVIISYIATNLISATNGGSCYPDTVPFFWDNFMRDANQDGVIDWVFRRTFDPLDDLSLLPRLPEETAWQTNVISGSASFWLNPEHILSDITEEIISSKDRDSLRTEIQFYLNHWRDRQDSIGPLINSHLRYLLAVCYELDGDEVHAVEIFYDLWKTYPESLWGQLAAARLELKP